MVQGGSIEVNGRLRDTCRSKALRYRVATLSLLKAGTKDDAPELVP